MADLIIRIGVIGLIKIFCEKFETGFNVAKTELKVQGIFLLDYNHNCRFEKNHKVNLD